MDDQPVRRDKTQKIVAGRGDRVNFDRPIAALDLQLALLDFTRTADWEETLMTFAEAYSPAMEGDVITDNSNNFREAFLRPGISKSLNGMAQYVSAEMCDLVTAIAEEMPPEMMFPTDLQFFNGLLVLGKKLVTPWHGLSGDKVLLDSDGSLGIRAIGYSDMPENTGIRVEDGTTVDAGLQMFLYCTQGDAVRFNNDRPGRNSNIILNEDSAFGRAPLVLTDHFVWAFGSPWGEARVGEHVSAANTSPKVSYVRRWLLALWRLMWQEILHPDPFHLDRPAFKRMVKLMPQKQDGDVLRIIRLRKIDETADEWLPSGGDAMRELSHGYWRRGHWRTLHRDTETERKVYVKGHTVRPDLPQADSYKVVSVER